MAEYYGKKIFLYVNYSPEDKSKGITKKIFSEIKSLRKMGLKVFYCAYFSDGVAIFNNQDKIILEKKYKIKEEKIRKVIRRFLLINLSTDFLKMNKFDFYLLRWCAFDESYLRLLREMKKRGGKVMLESLGYFPGMHSKGFKSKYILLCTKFNKKRASKYIDLILSEGKFETIFGVKAIEFGMGVDIETIKPHNYKGFNDEYNLLSVANETIYHGYDRLIKSLSNYYKNGGSKKIYLHLVGVVSASTKKLVCSINVSEYVFFYGKQYGKALELIYNKCNIGIGPLGQHRIGGKKDTGLKTKEYFAKGLPYFYSGDESANLKDFPYIYQVSSDENLIDLNEICNFYVNIRDENIVNNMREYAIKNYSWINKFKIVFDNL